MTMNEAQTKRLAKLLNVLNEAMRWHGQGPRMTLRGAASGSMEVHDIDADDGANPVAVIEFDGDEYMLKAVE